jgi:taurine dioxygenase
MPPHSDAVSVRTRIEIAELRGVDLRDIDDQDFAAIHRAWIDHQVLLFRGQRSGRRRFDRVQPPLRRARQAPVQENGRRFVDGYPEIYVVSNVIENGVAIGSLGAGEAVWHTDMSYLPTRPRRACCTRWRFRPAAATPASQHVPRLRDAAARVARRIAGLRVKHDGTYNSGGYVRQGSRRPTIR